MDVNIPKNVRGYLYLICIFGGIIVTYLAAVHVIGVNEVAAWTGFTIAVSTMARFNLGNSPENKK